MAEKWAGSRRSTELPPDWEKRRQACKAAAGGQCEFVSQSGVRCSREGTDADHKYNRFNHNALQWLCRVHHDRKTAQEAREGKERRKGKRRPPDRHPGLRG